MQCHACQRELPENCKFCPYCGSEVSESAPPTEDVFDLDRVFADLKAMGQPAPQVQAEPVQEEKPQQKDEPPQPNWDAPLSFGGGFQNPQPVQEEEPPQEPEPSQPNWDAPLSFGGFQNPQPVQEEEPTQKDEPPQPAWDAPPSFGGFQNPQPVQEEEPPQEDEPTQMWTPSFQGTEPPSPPDNQDDPPADDGFIGDPRGVAQNFAPYAPVQGPGVLSILWRAAVIVGELAGIGILVFRLFLS